MASEEGQIASSSLSSPNLDIRELNADSGAAYISELKDKDDADHCANSKRILNTQESSPDSDADIIAVIESGEDFLESTESGEISIPYSRVYEDLHFNEVMPNVFIRNRKVYLSIVNVEPLPSTLHLFDQYLFTIAVHHGDSHWTIKRKSRQVTSLHNHLRLFKAKLKLPAATAGGRERRQSMRHQIKQKTTGAEAKAVEKHVGRRLVKFPRRSLQRMDDNTKNDLEVYLSNLMLHSFLRSYHAVLEFFEISPLSFVSALGPKFKEGFVNKKSPSSVARCGSSCMGNYKTRWLVLSETCLFFIAPNKGIIRTVMLMDSGFQVSHGFRQTRIPKGLLITNLSRSLILKCDGEESDKDWAVALQDIYNNYATDFVKENRFLSFAPTRRSSKARWYVDGSWYMSDVADLMDEAKDEIFITDWWFSPDIYLKRPDLTGRQWMLSEVLRRQAERGVRIFILLYKEVELAIGLNSLYSKQTMGALNNNIKILRHPDHYNTGSLYWAHHEKMVIIDQMYAFIGGIDLCYGRWDDYRHKLVDVGHGGVKNKKASSNSPIGRLVQASQQMFTLNIGSDEVDGQPPSPQSNAPQDQNEANGVDATDRLAVANQNIDVNGIRETELPGGGRKDPDTTSGVSNGSVSDDKTTERVPVLVKEQLSKNTKTAKQMRVIRNLGYDLMGEVKERRREMKAWTEKKVPKLKRSGSSDSEISSTTSDSDTDVEQQKRRKRLQKRWKKGLRVKPKGLFKGAKMQTGSLADLHRDLEHEEATSVHLWVGKDYVNWIAKDLADPHDPFKDNVNRLETPRMPWHDIALYVEGPAARDAARHFIQRWNAVKSEKVKNNQRYGFLVPKSYDFDTFKPSKLKLKHKVKCQVLRSVGPWSARQYITEKSIYNAYIDAIKNAKYYIYIENQFFITSSSYERREVQNAIGFHLAERIIKAHRNGETFRVYVVTPLLPAFEGQIGTTGGVAMQYILHYTYQSIIRGPNSLIGRLLEANVCWQQYLSFCSLRTHEVLEEELVTELIYVHSKLMIVDDRLVIAGSANINDRSLLGDRDSEVAMIIEDQEFVQGKMNKETHFRGQFSGSLRMYLFSEHLGLANNSPIDVSDPIAEDFFVRIWQAFASKNTKIYDDVFCCIPTDSAPTFAEVRKIRAKVPLAKRAPEAAKKLLEKLQGRLVMYPLMFLKDEVIKPGPTNKEFLLPFEMWT